MNLRIGAIYHDWFKGEIGDPDQDDTRATPAQIADIIAGRKPLPPRAIVQFTVGGGNPDSAPLTVHFVMENGSDLHATADTSKDPYEGAAGKVKPQRFNNTDGYDGLIVTYPQPERTSAVLFVSGADALQSNVVPFPWIAKKG